MDAIISIFNNNDVELDILGLFGLDIKANKKVKEEAVSITKLNIKFEQKVKEKMAKATEENAKRMTAIMEELWASNTKTDTVLVMLSCFTGSTQAPFPPYHFPKERTHLSYTLVTKCTQGLPLPPMPTPLPVTTPPTTPMAQPL